MPRFLRLILGCALVLTAVAFILWQLSWMAPVWYRPALPNDPQANEMGDLVERRLAEELHTIRPAGEAWRVRIREDHINAWLATRLPRWIAHEHHTNWPDSLGTPQLRLNENHVQLALPVKADSSGRERVVVARFVVALDDTMLSVKATGVALGRVGVWGSPVERMRELASAVSEMNFAVFDSSLSDLLLSSATIEPVIGLADGRRVRVHDVKFAHGHIDVTFVTESPKQP